MGRDVVVPAVVLIPQPDTRPIFGVVTEQRIAEYLSKRLVATVRLAQVGSHESTQLILAAVAKRDALHNGLNNRTMFSDQFGPSSPFKLTGLDLMSYKLRFSVSAQFPNIPRHLVRDRYARATSRSKTLFGPLLIVLRYH